MRKQYVFECGCYYDTETFPMGSYYTGRKCCPIHKKWIKYVFCYCDCGNEEELLPSAAGSWVRCRQCQKEIVRYRNSCTYFPAKMIENIIFEDWKTIVARIEKNVI